MNKTYKIDELYKVRENFDNHEFDGFCLTIDDFYEKFDSEEGFDFDVVSKVSKVVGFWFYAQDSSKEQIDEFIKQDEQ